MSIEKDAGKWYILDIKPQQKVESFRRIISSPQYEQMVYELHIPKETVCRWSGGKKVEKQRLIMGSYVFLHASPQIEKAMSNIERDIDCRVVVHEWIDAERERPELQKSLESSTGKESGIKVGSKVKLLKKGYEELGLTNVQVQEISGDIVRIRLWIMSGCEPVDIDVKMDEIVPINETWEE